MANPFETLGLNSTATQDEIKTAYRKLAKTHHPDLNPGNKDAQKKFQEISQAYEAIGTPEARAKFERGETERAQNAHREEPYYYQTQGDPSARYHQAFTQGSPWDDDLLRDLFGNLGGRGRPKGPAPGRDTLYRMEVDFLDAALAAEKEITLPNGKRLRVTLPAGIESGKKLRFAGQGDPGSAGAPAGDAYVEIVVRPSTQFKTLSNRDLEVEVAVPLATAVLGGDVRVPTLEGHVALRVPESTSSGRRLRLKGKGIKTSGDQRSDLIAVVKIVLPDQPDPRLKQAIEQWKQTTQTEAGRS